MRIDETIQDGILIIQPAGRLDSSNSSELEAFLLQKITRGNELIVDLSNLDYISSAGLRVILTSAKRIKNSGGKLLLCSMKDVIRQVFEISGFLKILTVANSLQEAKQTIRT